MELLLTKKILEQINEAPEKDVVDIAQSERTPKIYMDKNKGIIKFSGRSMPDNANTFFSPLIKWVEEYIKTPQEKTIVCFDLEYFNSSASKMILQMIKKLKSIRDKGKQLVIDWYYMEDDDDMLDSGKTFEDLSDIKFDYICY